jgi:UDP-N-acetylmuramate dehydrogenase
VSLPRVLAWAAARGLSGLEPLSGIPGSLGGAVAMNAGSYGRELGELLARVRVWTPEHGLRWLERDAFGYGYRTFAPRHAKGLFVVAGAELWLERSRRDAVRAAMREHYGRKKAGQPVTARSAGCVFKNPAPEAPAGLLLDRAGFRGRRLGEVAFSEVHANFLVNLGRGTADQALELIGQAREAVLARSGHHLEMEVRVWP